MSLINQREDLMNITYQPMIRWGLTLIMISSATLVSCKDKAETTDQSEKAETHKDHAHAKVEIPSSGKHEGMHHGEGEGDHGHGMATLPVEKRVAFMSGHIAAGLALYRAGAPDQAAKHLLHPVSETHKAERAGIDALGFTPDVFKAVSKALDAGRPAAEIEPMLKKAEANMTLLQKNAKGDPVVIIEYLMETVNEEYAVGVKKGVITDPGEYQDAFGFSVIALRTAKSVTGDKSKATIAQLEALVNLWPKGGPLAKSTPKPVKEVLAQTAKVVKTLAALR
jgi:hypothetical protein